MLRLIGVLAPSLHRGSTDSDILSNYHQLNPVTKNTIANRPKPID